MQAIDEILITNTLSVEAPENNGRAMPFDKGADGNVKSVDG
jgi:hypothetical protein